MVIPNDNTAPLSLKVSYESFSGVSRNLGVLQSSVVRLLLRRRDTLASNGGSPFE